MKAGNMALVPVVQCSLCWAATMALPGPVQLYQGCQPSLDRA